MTDTSDISPPADHRNRLVVGCMTGTSIDALDVVLLRIIGRGVRKMRIELVRALTEPLGEMVEPLRAMARQQPMSAGEIARLNREFSLLHVKAIQRLLHNGTTSADPVVDLVAVHGQTVFHDPPASWQMINAPVIAHALQCEVVSDLRAFDLAAGGQGAPITPLADHVLYREKRGVCAQVIVNLGGFCNITCLPRSGRIEEIQACDVCACNHVLDRIARKVLERPFDHDGRTALKGRVDARLLAVLLESLTRQRTIRGIGSNQKRSLGTNDELDKALSAWIAQWKGAGINDSSAPERLEQFQCDLARTACAAVAAAIHRTVNELSPAPGNDEDSVAHPLIVLAGGGLKNRALRLELESRHPDMVVESDLLGVPAGYRESMGMAILGALAQDGAPITLPQVTGCNITPQTRQENSSHVEGVWCGSRRRCNDHDGGDDDKQLTGGSKSS